MRQGSAIRMEHALGPFVPVVEALRRSLVTRAEYMLLWRETPQGLIADIPEGKLLLTQGSRLWMLTVIFEDRAPASADGSSPGVVELGRRRIAVDSLARVQCLALAILQGGVPGGPSDTEAPNWVWIHGSWRLMFPRGELRLSGAGDGPCMLTFEDGVGVELLARGSRDMLEAEAVLRWEMRLARPLRLVLEGQTVMLRSIDVAGVLGYHALTDNRRVALVRAGDELGLVYIEGMYASLLARVSWDEALAGVPLDIDALLHGYGVGNPERSANEAPEPRDVPGVAASAVTGHISRAQDDVARATASAEPRASGRQGLVPMSEYNKALCRWYLQRLHQRLHGRGASKARALVRLILQEIEGCRLDITGSRREVHAALVRVLGASGLAGGDRNIRDCIDLLVAQSLLVVRDGDGRCTVLFSQFHDAESALMRAIAAMKAADDVATDEMAVEEISGAGQTRAADDGAAGEAAAEEIAGAGLTRATDDGARGEAAAGNIADGGETKAADDGTAGEAAAGDLAGGGQTKAADDGATGEAGVEDFAGDGLITVAEMPTPSRATAEMPRTIGTLAPIGDGKCGPGVELPEIAQTGTPSAQIGIAPTPDEVVTTAPTASKTHLLPTRTGASPPPSPLVEPSPHRSSSPELESTARPGADEPIASLNVLKALITRRRESSSVAPESPRIDNSRDAPPSPTSVSGDSSRQTSLSGFLGPPRKLVPPDPAGSRGQGST